jgi:hypothetical protein
MFWNVSSEHQSPYLNILGQQNNFIGLFEVFLGQIVHFFSIKQCISIFYKKSCQRGSLVHFHLISRADSHIRRVLETTVTSKLSPKSCVLKDVLVVKILSYFVVSLRYFSNMDGHRLYLTSHNNTTTPWLIQNSELLTFDFYDFDFLNPFH